MEIAQLMGPFINRLVCRFAIKPQRSFASWLQEVKRSLLEALDNQDTQFETLVHALNPPATPPGRPWCKPCLASKTCATAPIKWTAWRAAKSTSSAWGANRLRRVAQTPGERYGRRHGIPRRTLQRQQRASLCRQPCGIGAHAGRQARCHHRRAGQCAAQ